MRNREGYISASEISEYRFCMRAWRLSGLGAPSELIAERDAGREWHQSHADQVAAAARSGSLARAFGAAFVLLLAILVLYRILAS